MYHMQFKCERLTVRSREYRECDVVVTHRLIRITIVRLVSVLSWSMKMLNEHSLNGVNHS